MGIFERDRLTLRKSYLVATGYMHTLKATKPCKLDGSPLPWMNYNVISMLESRLNKDLTLFEFGSGYSTLFYSGLVSKVVSVEHDKQWFDDIKEKLPLNAKILYREFEYGGSYCRSVIETEALYDVIVVDGRDRVRCVINATQCLSDRGVIVLDDSRRGKYKESVDYLTNHGFKKIDFEGISPNGFHFDTTTIFYKNNNALNI